MSNAENTPIEPIDVDPELHLAPSASSDAAETTAPNVYADDIFLGAEFHDYHHFEKVFGAYQEWTHTVYKKCSSGLLKDAKYPELVKKYVYNYVRFECQHVTICQRGTGERQTETQKPDCPSKLRLILSRADMTMKVTVWGAKHNHKCASPEVDDKGKRILPQVIPYTPEVLAAKKAKSNRPTPYSRPARAPLAAVNTSLTLASAQQSASEGESGNNTLPIVSTEPSPRLEKLNQDLFNFLNPKSEAEKAEELRNEMKPKVSSESPPSLDQLN